MKTLEGKESMQKQLETLRRIQDLALMRTECMARGAKEKAESIGQEIAALVETLEPRIRALYSRLSATKPLFMAAMHNGACSGCGMKVSEAAARMVKVAAHLVTCTTCGRILYDNPGALASVRQKAAAGDDEVPKERGIARFSSEALMVPNLKAKTPQAAIEALARVIAEHGNYPLGILVRCGVNLAGKRTYINEVAVRQAEVCRKPVRSKVAFIFSG